jgi:hypothetical protein
MRAQTLLCVLAPGLASAMTYDLHPSDLTGTISSTLNGMQAGDEAVFHGGTYNLTAKVSLTLIGNSAQPIVVRTDGTQVVLNQTAGQNTIDFVTAQFVEISGLEITNATGNRGLRFQAGNDVTVRDCVIHGTASALTTNDTGVTYERFHIVHNEMYGTIDTAEGMYLGCNNDACRLQDSLIEGNSVHDTNGPNVTAGFGDGIQLKEGSSGNVIRDNVVHDTGAVCILVDSAKGHGPANVVERNFLYGCGDNGVQASQDATIRNNIVLGVVLDGIAVQPHQSGVPQNVLIQHNTVVNPTGNSVSVRMPAGEVVVANNALYPQSGMALFTNGTMSNVTAVGNIGPRMLSLDFVAANATGKPPNDVFPKAGGALPDAGAVAQVTLDDFNGTPRNGVADVGAYVFAATDPGWTLGAGFKPLPDGGVVMMMDAGSGMPDAGSPDAGSAPPDAGTAPPDAGSMIPDAGNMMPDAGSTPPDAGSGQPDAGQHPATDSGTPDAGTGTQTIGGCSCNSGGELAMVLAVLALMRNVRRRTRSREGR